MAWLFLWLLFCLSFTLGCYACFRALGDSKVGVGCLNISALCAGFLLLADVISKIGT